MLVLVLVLMLVLVLVLIIVLVLVLVLMRVLAPALVLVQSGYRCQFSRFGSCAACWLLFGTAHRLGRRRRLALSADVLARPGRAAAEPFVARSSRVRAFHRAFALFPVQTRIASSSRRIVSRTHSQIEFPVQTRIALCIVCEPLGGQSDVLAPFSPFRRISICSDWFCSDCGQFHG